MNELRYDPVRRFVPILAALFFPAAWFVLCALGAFELPSPAAVLSALAVYAALVAWPATVRFRTRLCYGNAGILWRSGLGPTVRIPRSRLLAWEHVLPYRRVAQWLVHYRAPRGRRHRTIHIPAALLGSSPDGGLFFPVWLQSHARNLRAIFPRQPLRCHWFTLT